MDQKQTPLVDVMRNYQQLGTARFHVPGHKGRGKDSLLSPIFPFDLTEITGLDDLHHPEAAIWQAQQLAAEVFHADKTFFLVGGSTAGNLAMIMAVCQPGESILVQRNVHKSVIHGLIFSQAHPVYLMPEIDVDTGLPLTVSLAELKRKLKETPKAKAVFLSNPNYFGMGMDLTPYAEECGRAGIPLLVDEAHGAHFGQAQGLPISAMQAGASAAVQSTHKMLPSLTMSSMLHVKGEALSPDRLRQILSMVQSSSPSYPLMASLDLARHYIYHEGKDDLLRVSQWVQEYRARINALSLRWLVAVDKSQSYDYLDPFKITLRTNSPQYHGFALQEYLEQQGIFPELADDHHVLLALSPRTEENDLIRLLDAIQSMEQGIRVKTTGGMKLSAQNYTREVARTPHEVFYARKFRIPLQEADGKISGEMIIPYPPGIPTVNPGERLGHQTMEYIQQLKKIGCRFHGVSDPTLETILVIEE